MKDADLDAQLVAQIIENRFEEAWKKQNLLFRLFSMKAGAAFWYYVGSANTIKALKDKYKYKL